MLFLLVFYPEALPYQDVFSISFGCASGTIHYIYGATTVPIGRIPEDNDNLLIYLDYILWGRIEKILNAIQVSGFFPTRKKAQQ